MVHPGRQRQVAIGEPAARAQQHVAFAKIDAGGTDVAASDSRLGE